MSRLISAVSRSLRARPSLAPVSSFRALSSVTNNKRTTNITGLAVVPNAREVLLSLYDETIKQAQSFDTKQFYNQHVVQLCQYRRSLVAANTEVEAIEAAVNAGCIEELIEQAEGEYDLLIAMNETIQPWAADAEGDQLFADYHPSFGQRSEQLVQNRVDSDEAELFGEIDRKLGLQTAKTNNTEAAASPTY